jgi:predicted anti-sigma-YlaC factor YlaD
MHLMAALDGEAARGAGADDAQARHHLTSCEDCRRWVTSFEAVHQRLQGLTYVSGHEDLWPALEHRLEASGRATRATGRLWLLAGLVVGWRSLQLLVELPFPALDLFIPLALVVAALWQLAGDPLAIQTFAPELQKRGA